MGKNIILNSLKESFISAWNHKYLFFLLFILQVVIFGLFFAASQAYLPKVFEHAKNISDYLSQQKLDEASVTENVLQQKNILGDDPLSISRNLDAMKHYFRIYLAFIFVILLISMSVNWSLTAGFFRKINLAELRNIFLKMIAILVFYLGIIFAFFYSIFSISFSEAAYDPSRIFMKYFLFFGISLFLLYFMFISLSFPEKMGLKEIPLRTLAAGVRKIHCILSVYLINILLFLISVSLLSYFVEISFILMALSLLLLIFSFVFGRIFVMKVVQKLNV